MAAESPTPLPKPSKTKGTGIRVAVSATPPAVPDPPRRVLLVSNATPITKEVIRRTIELATPEHAKITVLGIAKVYGTALGLPHPGLRPTRSEWDAQREIVERAAEILRGKGFEVRVAIAMARNAPKLISRWVAAKTFHAVVVPDPERSRIRRLIEGELEREIGRRTIARVHAVPVPSTSRRRARP